ncbi:hypothetical protein KIPB_013956, partial [Kipferlia bialata]|eukprot:g13956.t1
MAPNLFSKPMGVDLIVELPQL